MRKVKKMLDAKTKALLGEYQRIVHERYDGIPTNYMEEMRLLNVLWDPMNEETIPEALDFITSHPDATLDETEAYIESLWDGYPFPKYMTVDELREFLEDDIEPEYLEKYLEEHAQMLAEKAAGQSGTPEDN